MVWADLSETVGSPTSLVSLLVNLGSFGVLVYGLIYIIPKAIRDIFQHDQDMATRMAEANDRNSAVFTQAHERSASTFVQVNQQNAQAFRETIDRVIATFREEVEDVRRTSEARSDKTIDRIVSALDTRIEHIVREIWQQQQHAPRAPKS